MTPALQSLASKATDRAESYGVGQPTPRKTCRAGKTMVEAYAKGSGLRLTLPRLVVAGRLAIALCSITDLFPFFQGRFR